MSELRTKLMLREAGRLNDDAQYLRSRISSQSNGAYLLELLALEILLKCCVLLETGKLERGHDYVHIFLCLKEDARRTIISAASNRMGSSANYSDAYWLLALYGSNFMRTRYPYEAYPQGMSEADYIRQGAEWIDRGARVEEATFDFRSEELQGFIHALSSFATARVEQSGR